MQNPYEVTTEDKVAAANPPPAQISLTDCLACSGCVTSAEAVLVSLQSHTEVLNTLDTYPSLVPSWLPINSSINGTNGTRDRLTGAGGNAKVFVASVSPQTRASLAATYNITECEAGYLVEQLLSGPQGLASGGTYGSAFTWIIDTNTVRAAALVAAADEVTSSITSPPSQTASEDEGSLTTKPRKPILTSACPGWICYAEKTHPYVLPHLSRLKSPQALAGTLVKSVLAQRYGIPPDKVWHLAVMPCFDKKLEASRAELTSEAWAPSSHHDMAEEASRVRDVDCVITARELLMLADARGISFPRLPRKPLSGEVRVPFPDPTLDSFLFPPRSSRKRARHTANGEPAAGPSGGYLWHVMQTFKAQHPGSRVKVERGRNADVVEYTLVSGEGRQKEEVLVKAARYYGFRNIQNLVRRLKPARASRMPGAASARPGASRRPGALAGGENKRVVGGPAGGSRVDGTGEYAYVEVMACPGGCTNGGGQVKASDLGQLIEGEAGAARKVGDGKAGALEQREWLEKVDEAYFSASSEDEGAADADADGVDGGAMDVDGPANGQSGDGDVVDGISTRYIHGILQHWAQITGVEVQKLVYTSYRKVESDVGKEKKASDVERVAGLASSIGGGW